MLIRYAQRYLFAVSVFLFAAWLGLINAQAGIAPVPPDDRAPFSTPTASPTLPLLPSPTQMPFDGILATATPTRTPTPINIGNFVWDDLDGDGIQDTGEPGMSGVTVQLWNSTKNTLLDTDVTNASGNYNVVAPLPGDYRVRVLLPGGMDQFSPKEAGSDAAKDSDINPSGIHLGFTDIISIASNVISISSIDAGIIRFRTPTPTRTPTPINIGNFVWDDLDGDGIQDAGEPGMSGVTVQLWNSTKNTLLDTDVTNASGNYNVVAPLPGDYRVRVLLPGGMDQFSPKGAGSDAAKDSDINPSGIHLGFTDIISIASNVISISSIDAGIIRFRTPTPTRTPTPINIGNFVWDDLDGDGIQDTGEPGIEGVTVQLWNAGRTIMYDEAITNASGNYNVVAPLPGDYRVRVLLPGGLDQFSPKGAGSDIAKDSNINPSGIYVGYTDIISIASNVISISSIDAGIITANPIAIGDRVWRDDDGDGFQDALRLEPGIAGRRILLRVDSLIDYTAASTFTDATGRYSVTAPDAGTYYLCVVYYSGETFTIKNASDGNPFTNDDLIDSDANPTGTRRGCTDNFTVSANTTTIDIGFLTVRASIVGSVTLQGRGTAPNALWSQPHRVRIVSNVDSSVAYDGTVTSTTSGQLIVGAIPTGSYTIWVKGEHSLANTVTRMLSQGNNVFSIGTMREGDANGDNIVNINDFSILAATFGRSEGQEGYDDRADFSDNGVVDVNDFTLLAVNFGQPGAAMP